MREARGNVAVARSLSAPASAVRPKREKKPLLKGFTVGEKLLYLFSIFICVALAIAVISRYVAITELNVAVHKTEKKIEETKKVNENLRTKKEELGSTERISKFAESKGLKLKPPKVLPSVQP
ncbi:cell division protein FtsL [Paenactinomyces guangxiensis]|uniref:Cell division protein FtsL n=1 Tax=Paenactinomyces guangxiensis TaxID=1490290 RepID=A0A7W2A8J7_9BACL|nr:cell division protein FtsL [Paenactinomyces guangxiensis]MBA4494254.1 cell division protein FtsL [Paenactinomyces guangxiensis]MBH8590750.1 cell division protein FtsL [Paenactinomyces guangxiensis]